MAANTLHLVVSSISESLFDGAAISATLPGAAGEMTILPNHEPLITTLKAGTIIVRTPENPDREFTVAGGVLEISGGRAVVLV